MNFRRSHSNEAPLLWKMIEAQIGPQLNWTQEAFLVEVENHPTWVLEENQTLLAFACLRGLGDIQEISILATLRSVQRQGIMSALLKQLIDGPCQGRELWLEVHEANVAARNLYEKLGFQQTGLRRNYYSDGASAFLMNLKVSS